MQLAAGGAPFSEAVSDLAQGFWNATNTPFGWVYEIADGVGSVLATSGNALQTQTLGIGDGATATFCSSSSYCGASNNGSSANGLLAYTASSLSGGTINGTITASGGSGVCSANPCLTVNKMYLGAISPGLVLTGAGFSTSPTLSACVSGCNYTGPSSQVSSVWLLSANPGAVTETMNAAPSGGAAWPQAGIPQYLFPFSENAQGFGYQAIKIGSFTLKVNGTTVCTDTATFAYDVFGGQCTGAGIASSWINYASGAYSITFNTAPAANAIVNATWTYLSTWNQTGGGSSGAVEQLDYVGDGTPTSGPWSALLTPLPNGLSGNIFGVCCSDTTPFIASGYAVGAIGYSQEIGWLYGTRVGGFPNNRPGPVLILDWIRGFGINGMSTGGFAGTQGGQQWSQDVAVPSHFTGNITGAPSAPILTLTATTTDPMWEGEVIGCNPYSTSCPIQLGTQIAGLVSGTWGVNGSTYSLIAPPVGGGTSSSAANVVNVSTQAMLNEVALNSTPGGAGQPALSLQPQIDVAAENGGLPGLGGHSYHTLNGVNGGRRVGTRAGILAAAQLSNNPTLAEPPTLNRLTISGCDVGAIQSPCFDIGNTYAATATDTAISGSVLTFNGLAANARPIVVGQAVSCSGCNTGLVVTAISNPPTQSTVAGAGQIGSANNGFTVTLNAAPGVSGSGNAFTFGCSGTSGTGSNCVDVAWTINTAGTYGTAAALATCGVNNIQGSPSTFPITASISGTSLVVTATSYPIGAYTQIAGSGVTTGVYVSTAAATGLTGTYTLNASGGTVGSEFDDGDDIPPGERGVRQFGNWWARENFPYRPKSEHGCGHRNRVWAGL